MAPFLETLAGKAAWSLGLKPVGWAAEAAAKCVKEWRALERRQRDAINGWKKRHEDLCGEFDPLDFLDQKYASESPAETELSNVLGARRVPSPQHWHAVLRERWRVIERKRLFRESTLIKLNEAAAAEHLFTLAEVISNALTLDDQAFRSEVLAGQRRSEQLLEEIHERVVVEPTARLRVNMAGELPTGLVNRPSELDAVVEHLVTDGTARATALSTALAGAGGMGKTMLARLVCADPRIRMAYPAGILWVTLSESPNMRAELAAIYRTLRGEPILAAGINEAVQAVRDAVGDGRFLLVIDDVWRRGDTGPFFGWGNGCARLLTTRNLSTLPPGTHEVLVDNMASSEAVEILRRGLGDAGLGEAAVDAAREQLAAFANQLGEWPLLLGLVNGALLERVRRGASMDEALADVQEDLREGGIATLDPADENKRHFSVALTMEVAQKPLKPRARERLAMLGIFPEDAPVPVDVLAMLWGTRPRPTKKLCRRFASLSLVQSFDDTVVRLHDHVRTYLREQLGDDGRRDTTTALLATAAAGAPTDASAWDALAERAPFLFEHLPKMLFDNGLRARTYEVLTDVSYLEAKARRFGRYAVEQDVIATLAIDAWEDYATRVLRAIARAIQQGSDKRGALESQVHTALVSARCEPASVRECSPILAARHPPQVQDSAERVLRGHSRWVRACAVLGDGRRVVSASDDHTLRVWDSTTGQMLHVLVGHRLQVMACAVLGDGERVVSASWDGTLRVWDAGTGQTLHVLDGHSGFVMACAVLGNGRIVSASRDDTLRVWDASTGQTLHVLDGPLVRAFAVLC